MSGVSGGARVVLDGLGTFREIDEAAFAIGCFDDGIEQDIGAQPTKLGT